MTLYLNNDGSRWIDTQDMTFVLVLPSGARKVRKADWFESFGNFGAIAYRYCGKRYKALPKSASGCDTRVDGEDQRAHVFHGGCEV
jgi:hypothetical protein